MRVLMPNRRQFLAASAAALGPAICPGRSGAEQADRPLRLAVFGTMYNAQHFLTASHIYNASVVALVDPEQKNIDKAREMWTQTSQRLAASQRPEDQRIAKHYRGLVEGNGVTIFSDIRRLFDEAVDSFDALVVSHYDHLHGVACVPALRAGKPVCTERPLGFTIADARRMRDLAKETELPVVYRSPGTASPGFRRAVELVADGAIGEVREAHVWFQRGGPDSDKPPQESQPVPEGLDWDAWLGPLAYREYHPEWMSYSRWRETCNGGLGVFGAHTMIFPFVALQLPTLWQSAAGGEENNEIRVTAECSRTNRLSFPRWERIRWDVPPRGEMPAVSIHWHHGPDFAPGTRELIHGHLRRFGVEDAEQADALMKNAGSMLIGSEGAFVADDHSVNVTALPADRFGDIETQRPQRSEPSQGLYGDWISAIRGGPSRVLADFDRGGPLSELLMLGNIATLDPETTLRYAPATGKVSGTDIEITAHLDYEYREGWKV